VRRAIHVDPLGVSVRPDERHRADPASSGQTSRHRLNRGGNRQLNRALYTIALTQARTDPRAKTYMARRIAEANPGWTRSGASNVTWADVVWRTMLADAQRPAEFGSDDIGAQDRVWDAADQAGHDRPGRSHGPLDRVPEGQGPR